MLYRKYISISLVFLLAVLIGGCVSQRLTKQAAKFEQQGMYKDAANLYYEAVVKKNTNVDAKIGLKRTGQRVLDDLLADFNKAYNNSEQKKGVHLYLEAQSYYKKLDKVGTDLVFPGYYEEYYNDMKDDYLEKTYTDAMNALNNEQFQKAEETFEKLLKIDPNYRDAKKQYKIAVYEPVYRQGLSQMANNKYRSAYYSFSKIISEYGEYKDASDLKNESREEALIRIGVMDVIDHSGAGNASAIIKNEIVNRLNQANNPFIEIMDYKPNAGYQNSGPQPDAILKLKLLSFNYSKGSLKRDIKHGYIKQVKKTKDATTGEIKKVTTYKKVKYDEYSMSRSLKSSLSYQLLNARDNEILVSGTCNENVTDRIHYASYEGNTKNLVPGYWKSKVFKSKEDYVGNFQERRQLQSLLNGRKKIKTFEALSKDIINDISSNVAHKIDRYNPEQ